MMTTPEHPAPTARDRLIVLAIAAVLLSVGFGLRDPWPPDEPRFVLVASEMLDSGNWLLPTRNGELYSHKPPLFMWLHMIGQAVTGGIHAFLLPSLLSALAVVGLVHDLGSRLWGRRAGLAAVIALGLCLQFPQQALYAQIDMTLCAWTTVGLYGLVRHLLLGPAWGWGLTAFVAMGLGIITKGVGFLPSLILLPWALLLLRGRVRAPRPWWPWLLAPILVLLPGALLVWATSHAAEVDPRHHAYLDDLLGRQTVTRYANSWHHVHWFGYFVVEVIPVLWLPLSLALPWLLPSWWRRLRRLEPRTTLLLGWIMLVVLFFSCSPGKRGVYLLPCVPALALAAAPGLVALSRQPLITGIARGVAWGLPALLIVLMPLLPLFTANNRRLALILAHLPNLNPWATLTTLAGVALLTAWLLRRRPALIAAGGVIASVWIVAGWGLLPQINPLKSAAPLMNALETHLQPDDQVGIVAWKEQLVLHAQRPVITFGYERSGSDEEWADACAWLRAAPARHLLLTAPDAKRRLGADHTGTEVGRRSRRVWLLIDASDLPGH
ncbi:MAG: ArnT family glycosyltransferase [Planctomycetota bacterium]|jgi:4-amino-4-deoxy-L-arabinose transferase-like glycosyltransferase